MNDRKQPAPRPAMTAGQPLTPIKVRELRFCIQGGRDLPLTSGGSGCHRLIARVKDSTTVEIQYEPWMRHHRVREFVDGKVKNEFCIPESWCLHVPADDDTGPVGA